MDFSDRYDPGGELPTYLSAERLRLFVSRANVFSLLGSSDGLAEGMAMQCAPESSRPVLAELPIVHIGGASEVEDFGSEVERSNHPQPALRSMLRGPENLHERAKFLHTLPTNLEVLNLSKGYFSDGFFYSLAVECSSLQNLSISDATLGSGGAQEIVLRHESLRRLSIFKCRVLRIAIRCPQLDSLSLKRTGTASATLICPRLVCLDVSSCHKLSDSGVRAAATACPLLASLDMSNCAYVSDETLREISMACTNLRTLDASYCPNISLEGVRMPMLIEQKLIGCEGILSSSMAALSTCAMLEASAKKQQNLMRETMRVETVSLVLPRLALI